MWLQFPYLNLILDDAFLAYRKGIIAGKEMYLIKLYIELYFLPCGNLVHVIRFEVEIWKVE